MSAITPERLDEIERGYPWDGSAEVRELVRGYRAGLAAERELAAAREVVEASRAHRTDPGDPLVEACRLSAALDAYDAARKGEG